MPFDDASLAIAALGGYLPMPGGLEPADQEWTYREQLDRLGPASFVSAALLVSLLGAIVLFDPFSALGVSDRVVATITAVAIVSVALDVLAIVWPFDVYNGQVLYDWNRLAWAIVAVPAVLFLLVWGL